MSPAPWDSVPSNETFFVLITGANSGIGFGIGERIIDEYLLTRPLSSHIVVIPTTRSAKKSQETVLGLRRHTAKFAETSKLLQSRAGPAYNSRDTTRRVHILSVQLDLCSLPTIYNAADQLANGPLSTPDDDGPDADSFTPLVDVKIPRLDAVIFNAGIGGFTGLVWSKIAHNFLAEGFIQATTWPKFKGADAGYTVRPLPKDESSVGEIWCANIFGHYLFARQLVPLLSRPAASPLPPGRIIWESSVEGDWDSFSLDDFQGTKTPQGYESTKRLTDILCLTAHLPASKPYVAGYLQPPSPETTTTTPPKIYLIHPGVVLTTLFPLNAFMFFWYRIVLYLARWLGSPWHNITPYNGASAASWLALQEQAELDAVGAESVKWGSATDRAGNSLVKMTEVEGWGWDGRVASQDEDTVTGILQRAVGRKNRMPDVTEEKRVEFEALGAQCWREMEKLRAEWEGKIGK